MIRMLAAALMIVFALSLAGKVEAQDAQPLYAVEISVGENWDTSLPPNEQAYFAEHSANIRKLREDGNLRMGGRYADKGLLILRAADQAAAQALLDADPSFAAGTFQYQLHPFRAFHWPDEAD